MQAFEFTTELHDGVLSVPNNYKNWEGRRVKVIVLEEPSFDLISKTTGICGGDACIRNTRIPVWVLVSLQQQGMTDADILSNYPSLTPETLQAAWHYYQAYPTEIDASIEAQDVD